MGQSSRAAWGEACKGSGKRLPRGSSVSFRRLAFVSFRFVHSFVCSFVRLFIRLFVRLLVCLFDCLFVWGPIRFVLVRSGLVSRSVSVACLAFRLVRIVTISWVFFAICL